MTCTPRPVRPLPTRRYGARTDRATLPGPEEQGSHMASPIAVTAPAAPVRGGSLKRSLGALGDRRTRSRLHDPDGRVRHLRHRLRADRRGGAERVPHRPGHHGAHRDQLREDGARLPRRRFGVHVRPGVDAPEPRLHGRLDVAARLPAAADGERPDHPSLPGAGVPGAATVGDRRRLLGLRDDGDLPVDARHVEPQHGAARRCGPGDDRVRGLHRHRGSPRALVRARSSAPNPSCTTA